MASAGISVAFCFVAFLFAAQGFVVSQTHQSIRSSIRSSFPFQLDYEQTSSHQDANSISDVSFPTSASLSNFADDKERAQYVRDLVGQGCYDEVERFLQPEPGISASSFVYTTALFAMSKQREARHRVSRLFTKMQTKGLLPNVFTLSALFNSLFQSEPKGEASAPVETVLKLIANLKRAYPNLRWSSPVYEAAILACGRCFNTSNKEDALLLRNRTSSAVRKIRSHMDRENLKASYRVYLALLQVCASAQNVEGALMLKEEMIHNEMIRMDDRLWAGILSVMANSGAHEWSLRVLDQMNKDFDNSPNVKHCTLHLKALSVARQDEAAVSFLEFMAGIREPKEKLLQDMELPAPDNVAVQTVLYTTAVTENFELALHLLQQVKQRAIGTVRPNEQMYNQVLAACRDPQAAMGLIREMRLTRRRRTGVVPPSLVSYTKAVAVCRKAGDLGTALKLLERSKHDGIVPDTFLYSAVIWTAAQVGECDTAYAMLEEMKLSGCEPTVVSFNGLISALASAGRVDEAVHVVEELKEAGHSGNFVTFAELSKAIRHQSNVEDKVGFLERVYKALNSSERVSSVSGTSILAPLINCYGALGRFEEARDVFDSIEGPSDAACLRAMIYSCGNVSPPEWEQALVLLHSCDIVGGTIGPTHMDAIAVSNAMIACSRANEWEEALHILRLYGSNRTSVVALNALIASCGRCHRPDMAIEVLNEMESFLVLPDNKSFRNAIIACNQAQHAQSKHPPNSSERGVEDDEPDSFHWWECALSLLRRMREAGLKPDVQSLSSAISCCEAASQWQAALGVLQTHLEENDEGSLNLYCFNAAISACEKGNAWVEALELFERMKASKSKSVKPNEVTIGSLVLALDKAGQKEMAQSIYVEGIRRRVFNPWRTTFDQKGSRFRAMDLHHYSTALGRAAVRHFMETLLEEERSIQTGDPCYNELVIIVGKGLRSEKEPVLRDAVLELLHDDYRIAATIDPDNLGRIIVGAKELENFASSRSWHKQ